MPLPSDSLRVLLVEDDLDIAASLGDYLEARGVFVDYAYTLAQAKGRLQGNRFDVLVLDLQLPDGDGVDFCQELRIREGLALPVLILTARGSLGEKLRGFEAGALDYLVKPVAAAELLARLRAIARHVPTSGGLNLKVGGYRLDLPGRLLHHGERRLPLSETGATLLRLLMEAYPGAVTTEALSQAIWGNTPPDSEPIRAHIHLLRRQLDRVFGQSLIQTQRSVGYRLEV